MDKSEESRPSVMSDSTIASYFMYFRDTIVNYMTKLPKSQRLIGGKSPNIAIEL